MKEIVASNPVGKGGGCINSALYNPCHILNHLNMFGEGYLGQAEGVIEKLSSEAG